jgi:hypothetical protein
MVLAVILLIHVEPEASKPALLANNAYPAIELQ